MSTGIRYDVPGPLSIERLRVSSKRVEVRWLPTWTSEADVALAALPPMPTCPPELFRTVMQNPHAGAKRLALVLSGGAPVALIGLRHRSGHRWQLVTDREVAPRSWAPAAPGWLFKALRELHCDVEINEWELTRPEQARAVAPFPMYRIDLTGDYHAYWRATKHNKRLKAAEVRTRNLTIEVDTPGTMEWTIRTWSERWDEQVAATDTLLAACYHRQTGNLHTVALMDGNVQCAGEIGLAVGRDLTFLITARLRAYAELGVGTRGMQVLVEWACEHGFETFTLRSGRADSYKRWWAPVVGEASAFRIRPATLEVLQRGKAAMTRARNRAGQAVRSRFGLQGRYLEDARAKTAISIPP